MNTAFAKYGDYFGNQTVDADYVLEDIKQLLSIVLGREERQEIVERETKRVTSEEEEA
jgi:hypothetical protein